MGRRIQGFIQRSEHNEQEFADEIINLLAAKVQECQNQNAPAQKAETKLQALLARLLLEGKEKQPPPEKTAVDNPILAAHDKAIQQNNASNNVNSGSQQLKINITAQTAPQALAEAQYQLSQELANSLQKLRQVIEESKQVAQKINYLLAQSNAGNDEKNQQN